MYEYNVVVWCICQVGRFLQFAERTGWRWLRYDDVGLEILFSFRYEEIKEKYPQEYRRREENKLRYRYPGSEGERGWLEGGESYLDVKERCHRVLMKLVGSRDSILVVAHKAVIRVIMSYFLDIPGEKIPFIDVKMNTVYELEPTAYCTNTKEYVFPMKVYSVCYKNIPRNFLVSQNGKLYFFRGEMNFEKIALEVFPELDSDLVPYVASILEDSQTSSASDLADILTPIITGYLAMSEEEVAKRSKKLHSILQKKRVKKT